MTGRTSADRFFSEQERTAIHEAVRSAERRTTGEIAVMVVNESDEYFHAETTGGVLFSGAIAFFAAVAFFQSSLIHYIVLTAVLFLPCRLLVRSFPAVKAAFISPPKKRSAVRERALRAFFEKGLYRTREQTGVLFFLSLLERTVWVLADRGIYEKIRQERLDLLAGSVSRGVREGRAGEALCSAINEAGALLAEHFPARRDDKNELSDRIMTDAP